MHQSKTENTGFDLILKVLIGSYFLFLIPDFHYSSFELSYYYLKNKITIKLQMFSTSYFKFSFSSGSSSNTVS